MKNIILYKVISCNNEQHFTRGENVMEMLLKYFRVVHFRYNSEAFKKDFNKISLPDIKLYLKRQHPINNQKFVICEKTKIIPDFYVDCKYSTNKNYYILQNNSQNKKYPHKNKAFVTLNQNLKKNSIQTLIQLVNEARVNTKSAKKFLKQDLPNVKDVIAYYKKEFEYKVKKLQEPLSTSQKSAIVKEICEDVGLKYVVSLKYNKFFKDINVFNIYQYRKYLGVKLFEHYDGIPEITSKKLDKLIDLYKNILSSENFVISKNIPKAIFNLEIEIVQ